MAAGDPVSFHCSLCNHVLILGRHSSPALILAMPGRAHHEQHHQRGGAAQDEHAHFLSVSGNGHRRGSIQRRNDRGPQHKFAAGEGPIACANGLALIAAICFQLRRRRSSPLAADRGGMLRCDQHTCRRARRCRSARQACGKARSFPALAANLARGKSATFWR